MTTEDVKKLIAGNTLTLAERIGLSTALRAITKEGKALEIAYDRLDGKVPTFNVDSTMEELSRFSDEEIDAVITGRFHRRIPDSDSE